MQPTPGCSVARLNNPSTPTHSLHPSSQRQVTSGNIIVDVQAFGAVPANSLASKCPLCRQTLLTKHQEGYQLSFRKGQTLKGFCNQLTRFGSQGPEEAPAFMS